MSNTKIKNPEDFIQKIVDGLVADNAKTQARINGRKSTLDKHISEAEKAAEVIESADAMIAIGQMPNVQELVIARETVSTVERLVANAERLNEKDTKGLAPEDASPLAVAMVNVIKDVLPVPVVAAAGRPRDFQSVIVPADLAPFVVVVGDGEPEADYVGALSGSVSVYYYRTPIHAYINVTGLEEAGRKSRLRVDVRRNEPGTGDRGVVVDVLKVNVGNLYEGLPIVRKVGNVPNLAHQFAENLSASVNAQSMVHGSGRVRTNLDGTFSSASVLGMTFTGSAPKWSESIDEDGTRTLTVTSALTLSGFNAQGDIERFKELYIGGVSNGVGLLTDLDVQVGMNHKVTGSGVTYSFAATYKSRLPEAI